jgi:dynein assembly factor 1, axonemal
LKECWGWLLSACNRRYRKQLIARIPTLTYLDDRPVFPNEREIVEAWSVEGLEGERKARTIISEREKEQSKRNFDFMQAIRSEAFREVCSDSTALTTHICSHLDCVGCGYCTALEQGVMRFMASHKLCALQRRERTGLPPGDTDPALDAFSDSEWEVPEDPPELVDARSKLDMHMQCISDQGMLHTHYLEIRHAWHHALPLRKHLLQVHADQSSLQQMPLLGRTM